MGLLSNLASRGPNDRPAANPLLPRALPVHAVSEAPASTGREPGARRLPVLSVTESAAGLGESVME